MDLERLKRAVDLRDAGKEEQALREFREMARAESDPEGKANLILNQVTAFLRLKRVTEARQCMAEAAKLHESPYIEFMDAGVCAEEGHKEAALNKLEALLRRHKDLKDFDSHLYSDAQADRGILLFGLKQYTSAIPALQEALAYAATEESKRTPRFYLGACHFIEGQAGSAEACLLPVINSGAADRFSAEAHCYLGTSYLERGNLDAAEQHLRATIDAGYRDRCWNDAYFHLGRLHYQRGAYREAMSAFQVCEETLDDPSVRPNLYQWLAATCGKLGDREKASYYAQLAAPSGRQ